MNRKLSGIYHILYRGKQYAFAIPVEDKDKRNGRNDYGIVINLHDLSYDAGISIRTDVSMTEEESDICGEKYKHRMYQKLRPSEIENLNGEPSR